MKTIITVPTPNLNKSISFYKELGFDINIFETTALVTDGSAIVEINTNPISRHGIKLFAFNRDEHANSLREITNVSKTEKGNYLLCDSNCRIYLEKDNPYKSTEADNISPSVLGNFAGLSLETNDMAKSITIFEILGFKQIYGSIEQGWLALQNAEKFTISLMQPNSCPHLFFNPSLTYFNGKENLNIIKKIRELQIPITQEITHFNKENIVDNIIINDPSGLGFFVFND